MDGMQTGAEAPAPELARTPAAMAVRAASIQPATFNATARTVEVIFTTGADVQRTDWYSGETFIERLQVSPEAVDLGRLNAGAPVLDSHRSYGLSNVIGVVERAWIAGGEGRALVRFSEREDVAPIVRDVQAGILRNISAGYWVSEWRITEPSATSQRIKEAVRWMPGEISFVPVPADPAAQVRGATPSTRGLPAPHNPEVRMPDDTQPGAQGAPTPSLAPVIDAEAERRQVREAELSRVREIRAACRGVGLDDSVGEDLIGRGLTVADAQADILRRLTEQRAQADKPKPAHVQVLRDEADTRAQGIEGWLLHRMDPTRYKLEGPATDWRGASLLRMAEACLEAGGHSVRGLLPNEIARMALGLPVRGFAVRALGSTSDFPGLLANAQSKRLMAAYDMVDRNFTAWARRRDLPDFKTARTVELGTAPALRALAENGLIQQGLMGEASETWALTRYARNVSLSYPAIVNDDLGGFDRLPQAFANAAALIELTTVYGILSANANLSDGAALFSDSRTITVDGTTTTLDNNVAGALDVANFQLARTAILRMLDASGQRMMVNPNVLIVPTELEATALSLFSTIVVPATVATTAVNPFRGTTTVISTNMLTDANDWFVTVSAGSGQEAVEYGYEQGMSGPTLESFTDPNVDGMTMSARHSFGAKAVTFRTIARSSN
jgi:hypothetical protein